MRPEKQQAAGQRPAAHCRGLCFVSVFFQLTSTLLLWFLIFSYIFAFFFLLFVFLCVLHFSSVASRFVVHLLSPHNPRVFSPLELEFLQEKSTLHAKAAFELQQQDSDGGHGGDFAPVASSRKEPAKRRAELLAFLKVPLVAAVKANLERLATDRHGCHVLEAIVASQWLATDAAFGSALANVAVSAPPPQDDDEVNGEDAGEEGEDGKPQTGAPVLDSQLHTSFRRMLKGPGGAPLAEGLLAAMQQVDGGVKRFASDPNGAFVLVSAVEAVSTLGSRVLSAVGGAKFFKAKALQENAGAQALSEKLSAK